MKHFFVAIIALGVWGSILTSQNAWADAPVCECPKLSCNSQCEVEENVTFYSEKCSDGVKVRSCSRPTCVKLDPLPASCNTPNASAVSPILDPNKDRAPASTPEVTIEQKKVGIVESLVGQAWVLRGAVQTALAMGSLVNEKDKVKTGPQSRLQIRFEDGNEVVLAENSELSLSEIVVSSDSSKRNVLLQLLKGKVRSKVEQKYNGAENRFKVTTRSAVAGVRGTEFVVELAENSDMDERKTVVSTFSGEVELRGHDRPESAVVGKAQMAEYVEKGVSREGEPGFIERAYLSNVSRLSDKDLNALRDATTTVAVKKARDVAAEDVVKTCSSPEGHFNQCSWECKNNPKGETTCRTDVPSVDCVRSVCKADGRWREVTRLPASFGHYCDPTKTVVGPCDY